MINIEQTSRCIQNKDRAEDMNTSLGQAISSRVYCIHHVNQSSGTFHLITQITHTYKGDFNSAQCSDHRDTERNRLNHFCRPKMDLFVLFGCRDAAFCLK